MGTEVEIRRKEHGYNEVAEQKSHPVREFLGKFWGISAWMLELIMILSVVLRKYSDLVVVGALLVVNAILSFLQERRAAGVVETLRKRLQVNARVLREAKWQVVPARELVPGDIVRVRSGDIIPADIKLLTSALSIDQSALTGESGDADKVPGDVLSSGSIVRRGEGNGVVMLTGAQTFFGRTTELVQIARPKLHIEAVVAKVVRWLFVIVGVLLGMVIVLSLIRGTQLLEMLPLMLVLLMSAVPVALPVMFTVSMAVGSKELAKRGVLVTRLSAVEDAATMDVLCVDKTGTITMNQLAVTGVIPLENTTESDVLFAGDALPVASEIAQEVGLVNIRLVSELKSAYAQTGSEKVDFLAEVGGFAEVYPEDKYIVVQHLQAAGHVTGMTGDGVNDSPALRQAEVGIAVSSATDVAKGAASVVLTEQGLTNIVTLVEQGRIIYQRVLTWIINKISRTILKAAFVSIAFVVTGKFAVSAFAMLLLTFMTDFAKISLATDSVQPSKKPETWNIGGFIMVSVVLGIAMVVEALLFLFICWTRFGLATNDNALYTFSFLMLLYFAAFSILSARERWSFWKTIPGKALSISLTAEVILGTVLTLVGLPDFTPLPWWQMLALFAYAIVSCLGVNDALKVVMIKWRIPAAVGLNTRREPKERVK